VLNVAAIAVPIACKFLGPACVSPGGVIIRAVAVVNFVAAVRDIANSCPAGEATRCGIGIALAALSVVEFVFARQIAGAFISQRVTAVNGRPPVNASYANRMYDGPGWTPAMQAKYPAGVRFDKSGFARFEEYAKASVRSPALTGEYARDAAIANRAVGLTRTPPGYVWHHVEDGRTMILIPSDIHNAVRHTGGAAVLRGRLTSGS
jgi:hypothetical protein